MIKISLLAFLLVASSCGNPHLSADKKPVLQTIPTIKPEPQEEKPEPPVIVEPRVDFFIGAKEMTAPYMGMQSSGFNENLKELLSNNLNDLEVGDFPSIDFMGLSTSIEVVHKTEERIVSSEANDLLTIYSVDDYDIFVKEPLESGDLSGEGRGIDTDSLNPLTKDVMLFKFSGPVKAFGGVFLDLESTSFMPGILRVFDCEGKLVASQFLLYPDNTIGDEEFHFIGFKAQNQEICSFGVTVGDFENQTGVYRGVAVDEVVFQE
jgi:hypothetical protein